MPVLGGVISYVLLHLVTMFVASQNFDAISGATITSLAVSSLINEGTKNIFKYFEVKGVK